jgi:protein TonB
MEAKKTPSADLTKKVGMFTNLGLAIAVGLTLAAFEYKSYDDSALKDLGDVSDSFDELIDVPITQQPPPPPPPPPMEQPVIQEIPDEVKIEEKIDVNFDVDVKEATVVKEVAIKEVVIEEPFDTTMDTDADFRKIIAFFGALQGKNPALGISHLMQP